MDKEKLIKHSLKISGFLALILCAQKSEAGCSTLISGPVVYDISSCIQVSPEKSFDPSNEKFSWISGLDAAGKKTFLDTYRGLYLKGKVVKSQAVAKGVSQEQGALMGDQVQVYIAPGSLSCAQIQGKRIGANLREICCDGGGDAPCLLGTGFLLQNAQVVGAASSEAGDTQREKSKKSKDYFEGEKAFSSKKFAEAAKSFEKARAAGELDIGGHYRLGVAYRSLDQCKDALPPLQHVYQEWLKKEIWADEEKTARQAIFLLARCYARLNDPGPAVLLMNQYLLEPQKFSAELRDSLRHKDFGWIHTSKEYREYKKEAQKRMSKLKGQ